MTRPIASAAVSLACALCMLVLVLPAMAAGTGNASPESTQKVELGRSSCAVETGAEAAPAARSGIDPYAREVTRKGNSVFVSKKLAEATRKDEKIVLSKVAVRTRVDAEGDLRAYELVQIDRGSVVEKMGLKPGDQVVKVNGIPVRDLEEKRRSLEGLSRFDVTVLRKGKPVKLRVEVR